MGRLSPDSLGFSGPGWSPLYPAPPHFYRNTKNLIVLYETDAAAAEDILPVGLAPLRDPPVALAWFQDAPFSTFGPHTGTYVYLECEYRGAPHLYMPYLFVSSDSALAAGRELWGDAKKLAHTQIRFENEEVIASLERPPGERLATAKLRLERFGSSADMLLDYPGLCLKHIPSAEDSPSPAVLQLVRDAMTVHAVVGSDGREEVFTGPGSLWLEPGSDLWPLGRLQPARVIGAYYAQAHIDLDYGTILEDLAP